jgi:FtsP/CotA-like multicopper oxidase with cupredoxin domain
MNCFDVRISSLKITVVAADGQYVNSVCIDELRIAVAETFDVNVEPTAEDAYTNFAQSMDSTGLARGARVFNVVTFLSALVGAFQKPPIESIKRT